MISSKHTIAEALILILLFLSCFNFLGRGPVLYFIFSICSILYIRRGRTTDCFQGNKFILCLVLSISASLTALYFEGVKETIKPINFVLSYYLGYLIYAENKLLMKRLSISAFLGFISNLLLTYYLNIIVLGHNTGVRHLYNYWTNELTPGTIYGLLSSFIIGYAYYSIFVNKSLLQIIISLLGIFLTIIINNETATRSPYILMGVSFALLSFLQFKEKRFKYILGIIALLTLIGVAYLNDFGGINRIIAESSIMDRVDSDGLQTSRFTITMQYLDLMYEHPWGGNYGFDIVGFLPHTFILEIQNSYGLIAFFAISFIAIRMIVFLFEYKFIAFSDNLSSLVYCIMLPLFIQCLFEPVNTGYPQLLWLLFLYFGMGDSLRDQNKLLIINEE